MTNCILFVDDQADVRMSAHFLLSNHGFTVIEADSPATALNQLQQYSVDLILLDMNYSADTTSGAEGLDFLKQLNEQQITTPVVVMTAWSSVDLAVEAMQNGAKDFIEKPWDNPRLLQIVKQQLKLNLLEHQSRVLKQQQADSQSKHTIISESQVMNGLLKQLDRLAKTDATILLTGDNGTGKSSIARYIHQQSSRCEQPLVSVNMGAIVENLFESELFGHTKGAFTDAKKERLGRFEMAQGGTLFLDEIANIPLSQQAKLLRVLEGGEFEMVGSSRTKTADVRLICATNADIQALIDNGQFRADLYFRLNTLEMNVPSLNTRKDDIIPLANHFLHQHGQHYDRSGLTFATDAIDKLKRYDWPGNVRQLSHIIERAVLLAEDPQLTSADIHFKKQRATNEPYPVAYDKPGVMPFMPLEEAENILIKAALEKTAGNVIESASLLGISQSSMYRRMEKHAISK